VTPEQGGAAPSSATEAPAAGLATDAELRQRLARLEAELAETRRLLEVRNAELATLQGSAAAVETPQPAVEAVSPPVPVPDAAPGEMAAEEGPAAEPAAREPAAVEAPTPQPEPSAPPAAVPEQQPTLLDRLRDYAWALLALLAAGLGLAFWLYRRRSSGSPDQSLEETLAHGASGEVRAGAAVAARSGRHAEHVDPLAAVAAAAAPAAAAVAAGAGRTAEPSRAVTVADTLSGDGAISIEAGDPLAEADFHMAYGLYDQAADLVQLALNREPHRRDLKLKLVEVFFVWGNRERFVELARELHATRGQAEPGEWDKVSIMGRQLVPEEPMFAAAPSASAGALDLELHAGAAPTDFELPGGEAPPLDVDLSALGPTVRGDDSVDFLIDEPVRGRGDEEAALAPTVETPRVRRAADEPTAEVPTAELPIEDLGLDASDLADLEELAGFDAEPTRTAAPVEDTVQEPALRGAGQADEAEPDLMSATSMLTVDLAALSEAAAAAESNTVNLDLAGRTAELATIELEAIDDQTAGEGGEPGPLEEITMSEIGTKLDLARAYVDMGDPEGARSILEEVIKEGTGAHKQEAERLMVGLP
jgi:pilus assembly protein FimV